jgi:DNA-damage-inducible protein J
MNTTTILIKTDKEVKLRAQKVAQEIGIPLSTVLNMYLKQIGRERAIAFDLKEVPNKKTARSLKESVKEYERVELRGPFESVEGLMAALNQ